MTQILMLYHANVAIWTAFSKEDKILIKNLYKCKGYNAQQFIMKFPAKGWTKKNNNRWNWESSEQSTWLDWIEQCFTSPPTQYRLYGRRFLQGKRPNQQYQSTEGTNSTQTNQTYNKQTWTQNTASPVVYNNMGWLGDGSHRGQGCQAWTAVGLPPWYPRVPPQSTW